MKSTLTLTERELEIVKLLLSDLIRHVSTEYKWTKKNADHLFTMCDPANPETARAFKDLNMFRTRIRAFRKRLNVLQSAQRKVKRAIGNPDSEQ